MKGTNWLGALALATCIATTGCEDENETKVAPSATTLEDTKEKAASAKTFEVQSDGSLVEFEMEAPKEKIRGRVAKTAKGEISVDPTDITKTTGHLYIDIGALELFQAKANDDGEFGEEKKNPTQNKHARNWLEIGKCDPEEVDDLEKCKEMTKKNRNVEFVINEVKADEKDITKLSGKKRKVTATVTGDFLLHQHKSKKTTKVAITFEMDGNEMKALHVETVEPFAVGLAEHEVRPRTAFGKLAAKTLDALAPKVAKDALVSVEFDAKATGEKKKKAASQ